VSPAIAGPIEESSTDALIAWLGAEDANDRAIALALLVRRGRLAAQALRGAADNSDAAVREAALRGLAEIADPASADIFERFLAAPEPRSRAFAAHGLARCGDPRGPAALVATIDDGPDDLHYPYSLGVYDLMALGRRALPLVAPLLRAPAPPTRARAMVVVRRVVDADPDLGPWDVLEERLGAYDPDGTDAARDAVAARWEAWLASSGS
jgi:HEAT repeat protein